MTTKLDGALRREILIEGEPYTVTLTPQGLKLVQKGRRKGYELEWSAFVSGEAALATALIQAALTGIYAAALYRYATQGEQTQGFAPEALKLAFAPK